MAPETTQPGEARSSRSGSFNEAGATMAPETSSARPARTDGRGFNEAGATMAPETQVGQARGAHGPEASMRPGQQWPRKPLWDATGRMEVIRLQ